jgi:hypothetical protein
MSRRNRYVSAPATLSACEKIELIQKLYTSYFNTNLDTSSFSEEFYYVVGEIMSDKIPIKLEFLTDFEDDFNQIVAYQAARDTFVQNNLLYHTVPSHKGDQPEAIYRDDIEQEIEYFLEELNLFEDVPDDKQDALKERLFTFVHALSLGSRYYPSIYLESMTDEDMDVIRRDIGIQLNDEVNT